MMIVQAFCVCIHENPQNLIEHTTYKWPLLYLTFTVKFRLRNIPNPIFGWTIRSPGTTQKKMRKNSGPDRPENDLWIYPWSFDPKKNQLLFNSDSYCARLASRFEVLTWWIRVPALIGNSQWRTVNVRLVGARQGTHLFAWRELRFI